MRPLGLFLGSTDSGHATAAVDHDLVLRKVTGDTLAGGASECQPNAPAGCGYNLILRNNGGLTEPGQVGVMVAEVAGCAGATVVLHGGSASPVVNGSSTSSFLIVDITLPAYSQRTINVGVIYATCAANAGDTTDYNLEFDLRHRAALARSYRCSPNQASMSVSTSSSASSATPWTVSSA